MTAALLEERHITTDQFVRMLGVSGQHVRWLLTKSKKPNAVTAQRVAKELHVRLEEIVDDRGFWREVLDAD